MTIFWFRRDLRLSDNAALYRALTKEKEVQPIFIFDRDILDKLEDKTDARVSFIYDTISQIKKDLNHLGSDLWVYYGNPVEVWNNLIKKHKIDAVYTNEDYESYAISRDNRVEAILSDQNIPFKKYKDHVIFAKDEVTKSDGLPYTVFTPYKRRWLEKILSRGKTIQDSYYLKGYPTEKYFDHLKGSKTHQHLIPLTEMGFEHTSLAIPTSAVSQGLIKGYADHRNFPSMEGTSRLGIHFRFGTISIRQKAALASTLSDTYLSELVWRDFYSQILYHFPHVEKNAFRPEYDGIAWRNDEKEYDAWCQGKTGYPIVDAGMRELLHTGHMHNRVRMIVASFLTKHLLIDWRWGEHWFAKKLLDFDLASNNGGWQWAAGCGTDAAPYFRIFSPDAQTDKFDKQHIYIKKWVPEYGTAAYPKPIVDHKMARERCLAAYKSGLGK